MSPATGQPACRSFIVTGRVQGVFFRASTAAEAKRLRLTGHAINLENGDVEVLACGDAAALDELERWLHHGPRMASVTGVVRRERDYEKLAGFRTA